MMLLLLLFQTLVKPIIIFKEASKSLISGPKNNRNALV